MPEQDVQPPAPPQRRESARLLLGADGGEGGREVGERCGARGGW